MARSVLVTRTASWQLPGILFILPSMKAFFVCLHSWPKKGLGGVTSEMISQTALDCRSRLFLPTAISYSLNESSSSLSTVYSSISYAKILEIFAGADGK